VLAVSDVAANSVKNGGGTGILRLSRDGEVLVARSATEAISDDPLVDRRRPGPPGSRGCGLWLANQICDLSSFATGTTVAAANASQAHALIAVA